MITYENAMMELNFPGTLGNQKKRRLSELLRNLHDENIMLKAKLSKAEAALDRKEKNNEKS